MIKAVHTMRFYPKNAIWALFPCILAAMSAIPAGSQQSQAPAPVPSAIPQSGTPSDAGTAPQTAPPPKKKKKVKADPPQASPVAADQLCTVTFLAHGGMTQGGVSDVQIHISGDGPGSSVSGITNSSGEFQANLGPGDYQLEADHGSVTVRQGLHVVPGGTMTVIIMMP